MPAGSAYQALILPAPKAPAKPALPPVLPAPPHTAAYAGAVQAQQQAQQSAGVAHNYTPPAGAQYSTAAIPHVSQGIATGLPAPQQQPQVSPQQQAIGRLEKVLTVAEGLSSNPFMAAAARSSGGTPISTDLSTFKQRAQTVKQYNQALNLFSAGPVSLLSKAPAFASTIKFPAGMSPQMKSVVTLANQITSNHYNYEWGGGHGQIGVPGSGSGHGSGPGVGFDCSGAVSAILHAAGVLDQPKVASEFMSYGQPGPGTGPNDITIYASPTHTFAQIGGKFFGTSGQNPGGGAAWFPANPGYTQGFVARHVTLPAGQAQSVLAKPTIPGNAQDLMSILPGQVQKATARQYAQPGAKPTPLNPAQVPGGQPQQQSPLAPLLAKAGPAQSGKISWFGGPNDAMSGPTTASGASVSKPGVAVYNQQTLGGYYLVKMPNGKEAVLQQTDIGPAPWTGRKMDFTYTALPALGYSQQSFPTDGQITYRYLGKSVPSNLQGLVQGSSGGFSGGSQMTMPSGGGSVAAPSGGGGGAVAPSGGASVLGTSSSPAQTAPSQPQTAQQQAQQSNLQLLANFLKGSNPWEIGPKTAGTGGLDLFSSGILPTGSMDLGSVALQSLQGLAGNVPLAKPSKKRTRS